MKKKIIIGIIITIVILIIAIIVSISREENTPCANFANKGCTRRFKVSDGKGCHPCRKNRTQRSTRGRFFRMLFCVSVPEYSLFTAA